MIYAVDYLFYKCFIPRSLDCAVFFATLHILLKWSAASNLSYIQNKEYVK